MGYVLRVNGETEDIKDMSLESLQEAVGGYIEVVSVGNKYIIVDEEGKLKGKEFNRAASRLAGYMYGEIVGDVVVCGLDELE